MIKCGDEANYRLSSLGFPKNKVATVITDKDVRLEGELEAAAGLAYFAPHGMMVRYENIEAQIFTDVLVHEYSHMYWKNMPKEAKKLFIEKYKYYRSNFNDEDYLKYISQNDKDSYIVQKIKNIDTKSLTASDAEVNTFYAQYSKAQKDAGQTVPPLKGIAEQIKQQII